jgi:ribosomal protein S19
MFIALSKRLIIITVLFAFIGQTMMVHAGLEHGNISIQHVDNAQFDNTQSDNKGHQVGDV